MIKKNVLLPLVLIMVCAKLVFSASATVEQEIAFGTIIADPAGDVIEIDARFGPAQPVVLTNGFSLLDGKGHSGLIRVSSDIPGQMITLDYPASVVLTMGTSPSTMTIDSINIRSKESATSRVAGEEIDFDIGGILHMNGGQTPQIYKATITITVNVFNP